MLCRGRWWRPDGARFPRAGRKRFWREDDFARESGRAAERWLLPPARRVNPVDRTELTEAFGAFR